MDNLAFLRALDNECVDLIAIDPPFAANETFEGRVKPPITDAEIGEERALAARHGPDALAKWEAYEGKPENQNVTRVKDDWFFRDIDPAWLKALRDVGERIKAWDDCPDDERNPEDQPTARDRTLDAMREVIEAVSACATENEAAYIAMMGVRLLECRRVLKDTGSIYVHCDHHASAYLRLMMSAIFGKENFRNEIIWHYVYGTSPKMDFRRKHDTILRYSKTKEYMPVAIRVPRRMEGRYDKIDDDGRAYHVNGAGKRFYEDDGRMPDDVWSYLEDKRFAQLNSMATERVGYSTQKPLFLYDRIIQASSNTGDVVLDLFAGCSTTALAAEKADRQWIACDMAYRATTMNYRRFYKEAGILLSTANLDVVRDAVGPHQLKADNGEELTTKYKHGTLVGPNDLAHYPRQTVDTHDDPALKTTPKRAPISTSWTGTIPKPLAKQLLIAEFGPICWGCNFNATRPNGSVNMSQLEVDHQHARKSADGVKGDDELYNLAILCAYCNKVKGNRLTLAETREKNAHDGVLYNCETMRDLKPHPHTALQFANKKIIEYGQQASL